MPHIARYFPWILEKGWGLDEFPPAWIRMETRTVCWPKRRDLMESRTSVWEPRAAFVTLRTCWTVTLGESVDSVVFSCWRSRASID